MREDALGGGAAAHFDNGGGSFRRIDVLRGARWNDDLHGLALGVRKEIAVRRTVARDDRLDAIHGDRQRAGFSVPARGLPRFDAAVNPRPVFGNLHASVTNCKVSGTLHVASVALLHAFSGACADADSIRSHT